MKDRILKGWNFRRVLYIAMGAFITGQAILTQQYFIVLFGLYFASMGVFNFGCASGVCAYVPTPRSKEATKDVDYDLITEDSKR